MTNCGQKIKQLQSALCLLLEGAKKEPEEGEEEEREEEEEGEVIRIDKEDKVKEITAPVPSVVARCACIKELLSELVDLLVV